MPAIHIHRPHADGPLSMRPEEFRNLARLLRNECVERFSTDDLPLTPTDFSVYDEALRDMSTQSRNFIIRITLHHFDSRVQAGDANAVAIVQKVSEFLNTDQKVE